MSDPRQKDFDERHTKLPTVTALTKREYFAVMAMQGFLSNQFYAEVQSNQGAKSPVDYSIDEALVLRSIEVADALLKKLS